MVLANTSVLLIHHRVDLLLADFSVLAFAFMVDEAALQATSVLQWELSGNQTITRSAFLREASLMGFALGGRCPCGPRARPSAPPPWSMSRSPSSRCVRVSSSITTALRYCAAPLGAMAVDVAISREFQMLT